MSCWKYYSHALISTLPPHETPDVSQLAFKTIWTAAGGQAFFARWTTDFDCGEETQWWYVIKDTVFDLQALKAKRRYEINKGNKNFDVRLIEPRDYRKELYEVQKAAFAMYPEKYRPTLDREEFMNSVDHWSSADIFGAFSRETGELCGYAMLEPMGDDYIKFSVQKTIPAFERLGLNAALVYSILEYYEAFLRNGGYICDGERSINHETAFQDYLEKYFGFRKSYCRLNLKYRGAVGLIVRMLFPFRNLLLRFDDNKLLHSMNVVLRMEAIKRACM